MGGLFPTCRSPMRDRARARIAEFCAMASTGRSRSDTLPAADPRTPGTADRGGRGSPSARASRVADGHSARAYLADAVAPFGGRVSCHVPATEPFSIDRIARADDGHDRWGTPARQTVYLASDRGVAVAEYARHREPGASADTRRIVDVRLQAVPVLDLRNAGVLMALGCSPSMQGGFDRATARRLSAELRDLGICQGLLVPSMAFPDRPGRFNVVLFCERLQTDLGSLLFDVQQVGEIRVDGG
jgi:RES domain-containing protein